MSDILVLQAVKRVLASLGVQPEHAPVLVHTLEDEGYVLVPKTIIGAAGWTPSELWAYQSGIMHERFERKNDSM